MTALVEHTIIAYYVFLPRVAVSRTEDPLSTITSSWPDLLFVIVYLLFIFDLLCSWAQYLRAVMENMSLLWEDKAFSEEAEEEEEEESVQQEEPVEEERSLNAWVLPDSDEDEDEEEEEEDNKGEELFSSREEGACRVSMDITRRGEVAFDKGGVRAFTHGSERVHGNEYRRGHTTHLGGVRDYVRETNAKLRHHRSWELRGVQDDNPYATVLNDATSDENEHAFSDNEVHTLVLTRDFV
eukprot:1190155-Prorocentrum_minimum.AAC.4